MSIFGAIGSLVGGLFGNKAADKRQNEMLRWQEQMDNTKIQRTQADAKAAGVHPLAAMGASLHSPAPIVVGGRPDYSSMGQNIGRALDTTMSGPQKADDYTKTVQALNVDRLKLENDVIRNQLVNSTVATIRQPSSAPTFNPSHDPASPVADLKAEKQDSYTLFGRTFKQNPDFSAAERIQNVFGEPAEWPYALVKVLAELAHHGIDPNLKGRYTPPAGRSDRTGRYYNRNPSGW